MANRKQTPASCAALVATLLLAAPVPAAIVIGSDGKPVPRPPPRPRPTLPEARDTSCDGPRDQRVVTFNLAPQMPLADAVAWISSALCKPFLLPGPLAVENRTLLLVAPARMNANEAFLHFVEALDSVGLMIMGDGNVGRIVDIGTEPPRAAGDADTADREPYVTVLLHWDDLSPQQRASLFVDRRLAGEVCDCVVSPPRDPIIITGHRSEVERLLGRPIGR